MTLRRRFAPSLAILLSLAGWACNETVVAGDPPTAPANLSYRLEPSSDPDLPVGIVLSWDAVPDADLDSYYLYSRSSTTAAFGLRGITSSTTFHDNGVPHLQYAVVAVDDAGNLSNYSNIVTIDEALRLEAPSSLASVSLNHAVHLLWADNAFLSDPSAFDSYRVYSSAYDLDAGLCSAAWALEGTTVAPEFLVGAMANGAPRCFGVSALSIEGYQSMWSPVRQDTPRPDARNVLVYAREFNAGALAGFRFWNDVNTDGQGQPSELGIVKGGNDADIDFRIYRDVTNAMWIEPVYAGTSVQVYGQVADLTDIDFAPDLGYTRPAVEAVPTYGYVFEIIEGSAVHYGALRVTHVGLDYVIFDWSFQTDFGNPELVVRGGLPAVTGTGSAVSGAR